MDGVGSSERSKAVQGLLDSLKQAADMEAWGLLVEAAEEYQKTALKVRAVAPQESFSTAEKEFLERVAQGLQHKASSLQDLSSVQEPSTSSKIDVKNIQSVLQSMQSGGDITESTLAEALPHTNRDGLKPEKVRSLLLSDDDYFTAATGKAGTLVHRINLRPGYTYLTITIDKIGLKDPHNHIDPLITVSVKSLTGEDIEQSQDTPVACQRDVAYVVFGVPVEIQRPIEEIPQGSAIFFEFKHFKPKKGNVSTKCFSFMEMDEIKPGKAFLEIYKKPTDFRRRKLSLLSVKPLYLHLSLSLHKL